MIEQIQSTLLEWLSQEDNTWSVWTGDRTSAVKLVNTDGSQAYLRQINVSQELMAYDPNISLSTEVYKATWVSDPTQEPDANASWWISSDNGVTLIKVSFVSKKSKAMRSHWNIVLKRHSS